MTRSKVTTLPEEPASRTRSVAVQLCHSEQFVVHREAPDSDAKVNFSALKEGI